MSDFERRLRDAMTSTVSHEQPPGDLVGLVHRRHRRHVMRLAVLGVTVAVAVTAGVPAAGALLRGNASTRTSASPGPTPTAASDSTTYDCGSQTYGALGPHWRQRGVKAGPLWIINDGIAPNFDFHNPDGTLKAVPIIVMMRDNTTAVVQASVGGPAHFRFLRQFNSTDHYTLANGAPVAKFVSCSDQASIYGGGFTEYYFGVLVAGPRCVTLDISTSAGEPLSSAALRFGARCQSGRG
jgi:hypothetical protein